MVDVTVQCISKYGGYSPQFPCKLQTDITGIDTSKVTHVLVQILSTNPYRQLHWEYCYDVSETVSIISIVPSESYLRTRLVVYVTFYNEDGAISSTQTTLEPILRGQCGKVDSTISPSEIRSDGTEPIVVTVCENPSAEYPATILGNHTEDSMLGAFEWYITLPEGVRMTLEEAKQKHIIVGYEVAYGFETVQIYTNESAELCNSTLTLTPFEQGEYIVQAKMMYAPNQNSVAEAWSDPVIVKWGHEPLYSPSVFFFNLNIDRWNETGKVVFPHWMWIANNGEHVVLSDRERFAVLREGIEGFSDSTAEYATEQTPNFMAETFRQTNVRKREFGFKVAIIGKNHADLEEKRKEFLRAFSQWSDGTLVKTFDNGLSVFIRCRVARGYPSIPDGLPQGYQARVQIAELRFIATDPYFYETEQYAESSGGTFSVNVSGDTPAPCTIKISAETCTNKTNGMTMKNRSGKSIAGLIVSVDDRRITAVDDDGENRLANFAYDSQFWMLESGENVLEGVAEIRFTPRWSGI